VVTPVGLFGYTDKISVRPGEVVQFHVSAEGTDRAEAQLVRLIHGDESSIGPGFVEEEVACAENGAWQVERQRTKVGSFLEVDDPEGRLAFARSFTLFAFIHPTWPASGNRQSIIGRWDSDRGRGYGIGLDEKGCLQFWIGRGDETVECLAADVPLQVQMWYFVAATFDAGAGRATLYQVGVGNRYNGLLGKVALVDYDFRASATFRTKPENLAETPFLMAGSRGRDAQQRDCVSELYWGKIDRCGALDQALEPGELDAIKSGLVPAMESLVAYWDTSKGYTDRGIGDVVVDVGRHKLDARGYNRPVRGQTGWNWDGFTDCFRLAPNEFGGIEFHADALTDCNWKPTKVVTLPRGLKSGCYAMRLRSGDGRSFKEEHIVFFVRPQTPRARIAFLFPTLTYLALANERLSFDHPEREAVTGQPAVFSDIDLEMYTRGDFGLSTYDMHADGNGVCYSSYHRPIMNMRPRYRMPSLDVATGLAADLSLIAWLEQSGFDYEVLTDEDLHRDGPAALTPYACVISGARPEYYTERMLDATEDYVAAGGRYIYAGGNGFHATAGIRDDEPWIMECRRRDDGYKPWIARHGEHYMATDGMRGGPWKVLGRSTQKLVGIGLSSQGGGRSEPYRRMPDSYHRTVSWITKGVEGEIIGDFGLANNGAAGLALDYYDRALGTPPHTRIIASSGGHTDSYVVNQQLVLYAYLGLYGAYDWRVHADMTYFAGPHGGAVFACGSIAFAQSLPINNFSNSASRVLANVVEAFVRPGRLPGLAWVNEEKQWA
jgi:N,N-dimethylformamidase